jgi:membrane protein YdbS with pleckstrin-like domain
MNCPKCGTELAQGAAFCHKCGAQLAAAPAAVAATAAPTSPAKQRLAGAVPPAADDREVVLWQGQYSKLAMIGAWLGAAGLTMVLFVIALASNFSGTAWVVTVGVIGLLWLALVVRLAYLQLSIRYTLTNQRFIHERGLLWRRTDRIEAIDIDDVSFEQGPVERMLDVGTVKIQSSDKSTPRLTVVGIEKVREVATLIDNARRQERRKRGISVEAV